MKVFAILIILCIFNLNLRAQFVDSIGEAIKSKPKFSIRLDNRYSFTATSPSRITGFKVGAEFNDKFRVGGGYNQLNSRLTRPVYIDSSGVIIDTVISGLKMSYMSYFIEYVFFKNKRWEFSIPIQIGIGNTHYEYHYRDAKFKNNWSVIINYEASISGQYKILKWFGIGAGLGYQLMLKDNPAIKENFNTPIYSLKLKIFLGDIYRSVFPKRKKD
ncbi:MAG: hypothetical protein PHX78_12335 [bacterium]|nr:hypothetical protein [bacterium]